MRYLLCRIIGLLAGCTATPDPVDRLVADLSATHGLWINGAVPIIQLPEIASTEQVLERVFEMTGFERGRVKTYKVSKIRQVQIPVRSPLSVSYMAALVRTDLGEKIVLLRYGGDFRWWSRVYDANQTLHRKTSPTCPRASYELRPHSCTSPVVA